MIRVAFHNLGCKVNSYETQAMQKMLEEAGYILVPFEGEAADVYIINTCSVTNIADRKSRQMIHKARKDNPKALIVATGCYVESAFKRETVDEDIDLIVGNNEKSRLARLLDDYFAKGKDVDPNKRIRKQETKAAEETSDSQKDTDLRDNSQDRMKAIGSSDNSQDMMKVIGSSDNSQDMMKAGGFYDNHQDMMKVTDYDELEIDEPEEHTRAYVKIQDGCNRFCTYCIIPFVRGGIRSRKAEDVIKEIERIAEHGCKEVVLTGIHLSSYGLDCPDEGIFLIDIIEKINAIRGIERIRLGSLEPKIVTKDFAARLAGCHKVCPHFHLSLQSGCDSVLKRMNRRYTTEEFEEGVRILRNTYEMPAITTDVIVGFPGETVEEFETTKAYLEKICFYELHVFKYSRRKGTVADLMPGQLTDREKSERSDVLLELDEKLSGEYRRTYIGKTVQVLLEEVKEIEGQPYFVGYTRTYVRVALAGNPKDYDRNTLVSVRITDLLGKDMVLGVAEM